MSTMSAGGQSFYAVIIICLLLFISFTVCLGIRFIRQKKNKKEESQLSSLRNDDWQQLRSVATPLDSTDVQTLQAVSSNIRNPTIYRKMIYNSF